MSSTHTKKVLNDKTIEVIHGSATPTHAVIWLHGLGATANDFPPVVPYLGLHDAHSIRFVFPQAPDRPITINGGYMMPGWYDIKGMDLSDKEDLVGMTESQATLLALIDGQISEGIPSQNIVIAGFSQGGAVAYYTGLRSEKKLAGIMALSTYMPFVSETKLEYSQANLETPVLAMHGTRDGVVPLALGLQSVEAVKTIGLPVSWKTYAMEHSVIPEQLLDIGQWINTLFSE